MILKIKDLAMQILLEDYESDKQQRDKAVEVFNWIYNNFNKLNWDVFKINMNRGDKKVMLYCIGFRYNIEGVDFNLRLAVQSELSDTTAGSYSHGGNSLYLYTNLQKSDLPQVDKEGDIIRTREAESKLAKFREYFRQEKSTIIHELIHYVDIKRAKGNVGRTVRNTSDLNAYFKSPLEFNAYFQQAVHDFEVGLDHTSIFFQAKYMESFDNLLQSTVFKYQIPLDYLEKSEIGRRFKKRLYQYYEGKRQEVDSSIERGHYMNLLDNEIRSLEVKKALLRNALQNTDSYVEFIKQFNSYPELSFLGEWYINRQTKEAYSQYKDLLDEGLAKALDFYNNEKETYKSKQM